jgi:hypothetical protein
MTARLTAIGILALLSSLPLGCGSSSTPTQAELTRRAEQRLNGSWIFVNFVPDQDFEPAVAGLVQSQFGTLRVDVADGQLNATGTALSTTRRYRVMGVQGDRVSVVIEDEPGVGYDVLAEFQGNELKFDSQSSPWRGRGLLRRIE